ncbi:Pseudo histidine-containing phosphotransfer protein 1 [Linum perenne]
MEYMMHHFVGAVQEQGILDRSITRLIDERGPNKPRVVIDSICMFIYCTRAILHEIHRRMLCNVITYESAAHLLEMMHMNTICVGAPRLTKVCNDMIEACNHRDQLMCNALFTCVRFEFATVVHALHIIFEGTLDENFDTVAELRSPGSPRFLVDIIETYVTDSAAVVARLESEINQTVPFYDNVVKDLLHLKGSSSSMGGGRVSTACIELQHHINGYDKQSYLESFKKVKQEYHALRDTLIEIGRMEMSVLDQDARSQEDNQSKAPDE